MRAYQAMCHEISELKEVARENADFQRQAGAATAHQGDFDSQPAWTMGDISSLVELAKGKEKETSTLGDDAEVMRRKIIELQSMMLKCTSSSSRALKAESF